MLNEIDLSRADLNLLVLFEAVLAERNVARAAARLNLSPSAVSHGLGRLRRLLEDPLFLRTPKGVVPSDRAAALAAPIADILARVRSVIGTAEPFDPARSQRRFAIGAADATLAAVLPALLAEFARAAPGIDLSVRHLLPNMALGQLENRALDLALAAVDAVPARYAARIFRHDEFVIAARAGHPFLRTPSLRRYCAARHALVSVAGDARGFVDEALEKKGLTRRVALVVPNFMLALAAAADSDLLAAVPGSLLAVHAARFGLASVKAPLPLPRVPLRVLATRAGMADPGVAWLFDQVSRAGQAGRGRGRQRPGRGV